MSAGTTIFCGARRWKETGLNSGEHMQDTPGDASGSFIGDTRQPSTEIPLSKPWARSKQVLLANRIGMEGKCVSSETQL